MPRRSGLVSQYLENVSRDFIFEHQHIIRDYVRWRHGVYALYRRGKLYYVGLASNLRTRLKAHLKGRHAKAWDRFSVYLTLGDTHLKEMESLVLRIVQPKGNRVRGGFTNSENLKRRLARDMRNYYREQLAELLGRVLRRGTLRRKLRRTPGRMPVLARYTTTSFKLKARYKGKTIRAAVRRDGRIRCNGSLYTSPSQAAARACGLKARDGWHFWIYERAPGDWVLLDQLRRR